MRNSVVRLHHPTAVRSAAFSCSQACPVHAVVGLDNGSLYRLARSPLRRYTFLIAWQIRLLNGF